MQKNILENIKGSFFGIVNSSIQSTVPLGFLLAGILFDINSMSLWTALKNKEKKECKRLNLYINYIVFLLTYSIF